MAVTRLKPQALDYDTGWRKILSTLTYASATTVTISGDWTGVFQKGDKLTFTQSTGGTKYFYIVGVSYGAPNTTLTLLAGNVHTVANEAITLPYYSKIENPQGFPGYFAYTASLTGFSADPTHTESFWINGNVCHIRFSCTTNGTSNSTAFTISLPVNAITTSARVWKQVIQVVDNGTVQSGVAYVAAVSQTLITLKATVAEANFTNSGNKSSSLEMWYEI